MKKNTRAIVTVLLCLLLVLSSVACSRQVDTGDSSSGVSTTDTTVPDETGSTDDDITPTEIDESGNLITTTAPNGTTGKGSNTTKDNKTTTKKATASTTSAKFNYKYENVKKDLKGRVIKIANQKWWEPKNENAFMAELIKRISNYEKKWNFKIEWVYPAGEESEYHSKISQSVLSGKPLADMVWVNTNYLFPGFISSGVVQNVSDLGVFNFSEPKWNKNMMDVLGKYKNKYYIFEPKGFSVNGYQHLGYGVFFNRDYFSKNSLPDLYKLVKNNEWTWDKMIQTAKDATKTVGGKQVYGLTIWTDAFPFISSRGASIVKGSSDGTYTFNATSKELIEALNYYFENAATGPQSAGGAKYPWIHPHTGKWDFPMAAFKDGKAAMCVGRFDLLEWYWQDLNFKWGFVPFPKYDKNNGKYGTNAIEAGGWSILNVISDAKDVAMVIDAITDAPVNKNDYRDFYENIAQDQGTVDMIGIILNEGEVRYDCFYQFSGVIDLFWSAWDKVRTGEMTPSSAMQSIQTAGQQKVNDVVQLLKNVK